MATASAGPTDASDVVQAVSKAVNDTLAPTPQANAAPAPVTGFTTGPILGDLDRQAQPASVPFSPFEGQDWAGLTRQVFRFGDNQRALFGDYDAQGNMLSAPEPRISPEEANAKYAIDDPTSPLKFTTPIPESVAKSMHDAKVAELDRRAVAELSPQTLANGVERFGAGFAAGAIDPLNVAAAFIPVVGEARYADWLATAGSPLARAGIRVSVGAAQGVAGQVPLSALRYGLSREEQADYSATDAMLDAAYGGLLGGGLHAAGGAIGDALTGRFRGSIAGKMVNDSLETREAALRTALAQLGTEQPVQVEPIFDRASGRGSADVAAAGTREPVAAAPEAATERLALEAPSDASSPAALPAAEKSLVAPELDGQPAEASPAADLHRDLAGTRADFPDEAHARLFDYGQQLEGGAPASDDVRQALWNVFHGYVEHDAETAPFAKPSDVDGLALDYFRDAADHPKGTPFDAGNVVDPDLQSEYFRRAVGGATDARHVSPAGSAYTMLDPAELTVDPKRFQYKAADERGSTGALAGAERWEPTLANPITAWRGNDGKLYVVNGHQRVELANRAVAAGQEGVKVPARVFSQAEGHSAEYMRALGAYQNIAEGSGTAVDAAKVLRGKDGLPADRRLPDLPPKSQLVDQAKGLAALDEHAFGMVVNEIVPAAYAAEVGRLIRDPAEQLAAMRILAKADPANLEQARFMVEDIRNSGFLKGEQASLFGSHTTAESLFAERARILENANRTLRQLKGTFATAVEHEATLADAGNVMSRDANLEGRARNEALQQSLRADATRRGPLSDALTSAARDLKDGKSIAAVTRDFIARARALAPGADRADEGLRPGAADGGDGPAPAEQPAGDTAAGLTGQGRLFGDPDAAARQAIGGGAGDPTPEARVYSRAADVAIKTDKGDQLARLAAQTADLENEVARAQASGELPRDIPELAAAQAQTEQAEQLGRAYEQAASCIAMGGL